MGGKSSPARPRVALFGLFGVGNHGNEASLAAALAQLRRVAPLAVPVVVCPVPDVVASEHGVEAVPISPPTEALASRPRPVRTVLRPFSELRRWIATLRLLRSVDLVIVPGTGLLDDFGVEPSEVPLQLLRWTLCARILGRPFCLLSVGAGPIKHPASRTLFRAAARLATSCSYRDQTSYKYMAGIGRNVSADRVNADLVFALPLTEPRTVVTNDGEGTVGLGVMAYYGWRNHRDEGAAIFDNYVEKIVDFVVALLDRRHDVRMLIGEVTDTAAVNEVRRRVVDRLGPKADGRVEFAPVADVQGLVAEINRTDCVVATRYHNVIAALMAGRPVVSVGYADKNRDLLEGVGLGTFCQDVETFDLHRLIADTEQVLADRTALSTTLGTRVAELGQRAAKQFDTLPWHDGEAVR